ncbi:MAG: tRNA (guanine-N(7)-)-methyltransferase [Saezia sanguinis]
MPMTTSSDASMANTAHDPADASENQSPAASEAAYPRRIRSFVLRAGRTTEGQARAFRELSDKYIVPYQGSAVNWSELFGRKAPEVLEIGFGMGEATAHIAAVKPDVNFIACEVHPPGVGKLMLRLEAQQIANVRIVQHDAVEVLEQMIAPASLAGVHIFFPDPWHKKRHNKRRLIQAPLVKLLASRLQAGGYIHCATDWQPYAEQILEVLSSEPDLRNTSETGYAPKPDYRPLTKFENRGLKLGHGVWDIVFAKV